jgi:hypothetical protein
LQRLHELIKAGLVRETDMIKAVAPAHAAAHRIEFQRLYDVGKVRLEREQSLTRTGVGVCGRGGLGDRGR